MIRVCFATTECVPFAKAGGLADVSGALPKALAAQGCEVKLFLPLYQGIPVFEHGFAQAHELDGISVQVGGKTVWFNTWYGHLPDSSVEVYLIDCPTYFHRPYLYGSGPEEAERFAFFQHAILKVLQRFHWAPDVLHCNDWGTALLPVFLRKTYAWDSLFDGTASLLSLHNLGWAYQGRFPESALYEAGLGGDLFYPGGPYECYGSFCFLKAGIVFADLVATVSPTYAREIQQPNFVGDGLDGVLRSRGADLYGVLNGIDTDVWNPARDALIPHPYDIDTLDRKVLNKQELLYEARLPFDERRPVVGLISRLTEQKGIDLLHPILQPLLEQEDVQFVVLGSGDTWHEDFFNWASAAFPERVSCYIGYNDRLAHLIEAGADMFVMPSRYEPCGLNQMYSLAYGTVPVVRATGGLADTVQDYHATGGLGNGFSFYDYQGHALHDALARAINVFHDRDAWRALQRRGMQQDFSWDRSAGHYLALYRRAVAKRRG